MTWTETSANLLSGCSIQNNKEDSDASITSCVGHGGSNYPKDVTFLQTYLFTMITGKKLTTIHNPKVSAVIL
jgi:hypothetical protein